MRRIHENEIIGQMYNGVEVIQFHYKDEKGRKYWIFKCPYCNNFFVARLDSVKSGNTKSCGCLREKHARKVGLANKESNAKMYPLGCDFGICYYDNYDGYFIFDTDKRAVVERYHWTALVNGERVEPIGMINGKLTLLSRLLMDTPEGMECDHINHNTNDVRICNLRNCTKKQNLYNREQGQGKIEVINGKYGIINFSKEDTSGLVFDNEIDAYEKLCELQDTYYGEYSYRRSQEIARLNETNQFTRRYRYLGGVLEEINNLPEKNYLKVMLTNTERNKINGLISDENETTLFLQIIRDYNEWKRTEDYQRYMESMKKK